MRILGLVGATHDSGLAILQDGLPELVLEEERFCRRKRTKNFPGRSVVTALGEFPKLFRNQATGEGHWLLVKLEGRKSNRDGLGAVLRLETEGGRTLWNHATTSVGYASSSDPRVHFGLGRSPAAKRLEIQWPSGVRQVLVNVIANQVLAVKEPEQ